MYQDIQYCRVEKGSGSCPCMQSKIHDRALGLLSCLRGRVSGLGFRV